MSPSLGPESLLTLLDGLECSAFTIAESFAAGLVLDCIESVVLLLLLGDSMLSLLSLFAAFPHNPVAGPIPALIVAKPEGSAAASGVAYEKILEEIRRKTPFAGAQVYIFRRRAVETGMSVGSTLYNQWREPSDDDDVNDDNEAEVDAKLLSLQAC
ncbi:unnamed protein product [Gongylonema pulchrum]|uniref:Glutathione synthetase n=1 Tax=Gongylonema pulchrum TaxID=637853 RepID=A0A183DC23_9BILA|nr:unnamed protein product [Gongylonema pulchrum]